MHVQLAIAQLPSWREACSVAYWDTVSGDGRVLEFLVIGNGKLYTVYVHQEWESSVNVRTRGPVRWIARNALDQATKDRDGVQEWKQEMCGNSFHSESSTVRLYLDFDEKVWWTTWTNETFVTYGQRFRNIRGNALECFDSIRP